MIIIITTRTHTRMAQVISGHVPRLLNDLGVSSGRLCSTAPRTTAPSWWCPSAPGASTPIRTPASPSAEALCRAGAGHSGGAARRGWGGMLGEGGRGLGGTSQLVQ